MTQVILASASPRRKELLEQVGVRFELYPVDIDETPMPGELPVDYVLRMANTKAHCAWQALNQSAILNTGQERVLLACDTSVVLAGRIFGKPSDWLDFEAMMQQLSGQVHEVLTAVCVIKQAGAAAGSSAIPAQTLKAQTVCVTTKVKFKPLATREIAAYWRSGEPKDKAGGYGIQGKGAVFVESIEGSYSNVVGLPLTETVDLLAQFGVDIWSD